MCKIFNKKVSGFTLIELLVVIAIIGILAAIVLVSLSRATDRAKDARIQADLTQVRSKAALIYADNTSYALLCSSGILNASDTELNTIQNDIQTQQGGSLSLVCQAGTDAYCVAAGLLTKGNAFCVDSTGWAGTISTTTQCDATHKTCASD